VLRTTKIKDYEGEIVEPVLFGVLSSNLNAHNYCSEEALDEAIKTKREQDNKCTLSDKGKEAIRQQIKSCDLSTDDRKLGRKGTCSIYLKDEGDQPYKKLYEDLLPSIEPADGAENPK